MNAFYHVTGLIAKGNYGPDSSILAREKGKQLHKIIAQQYAGSGKYAEVPQACLLANKEGIPRTILVGTPDLFWFEPLLDKKGEQNGFTLFIVDHKTVSLKDKLYCKKEGWSQLTLYGLLIPLGHLDIEVREVVFAIGHYQRTQTIKDSLHVVKNTQLPPIKLKELVKKATKFLSDYFQEEIQAYSLQEARIHSKS